MFLLAGVKYKLAKLKMSFSLFYILFMSYIERNLLFIC